MCVHLPFCLLDSLPPSSFILHAIPSHCLPKAKGFKEDDERCLVSVSEEFQHLKHSKRELGFDFV